MMLFQITRVYHVVAETADEARATLATPPAASRIDFESIQVMPSVEQPSEVRLFAREAVRQLTGLTLGPNQKQEPRRQS